MFYNNINPVLLKLGPLEIRYYGIIYALGFVIAYFMLVYLAKKKHLELGKEDIADFLFYEIMGIVAGSRLFYVVFYNLKYYISNPLQIFALWHGGLSFHGGLIGAVIAGIIFTKRKKIDFYKLADIVAIPVALGLALGRIGNFINGELYGPVTMVPWAVKFQGVEGFRHPSQLYEALKNFFIFAVLWKGKDMKLPKGFLFWLFVTMYAFLRFIAEFFRLPDSQLGFFFGWLTMGQLLSIVMFATGFYFLQKIYRKSVN